MMKKAMLFAVVFASVACASVAAPRKSKTPAVSAKPQQQNQFVTVDEFVKAGRKPGTLVSIEGYIVVAYKTGSSVRAAVNDSVDKVLSAKDADANARSGAKVTVPASLVKGRCAWSAKGVQKYVMYTGSNHAQKKLHDVVEKMRVTGIVGRGKGIIANTTKIEYTDPNGEFKPLR